MLNTTMPLLAHLSHQFKVMQSLTSSLLQFGKGMMGTANPKQPPELLKLYEMEGCPYCRRVREVLTLLNLDYISYPCPKKGTKYRPKVVEMTGKAQFPFFIDPNNGSQIQESAQIIAHLFQHYGNTGKTPKKYQNLPNRDMASTLATVVSALRGLKVQTSNKTRPQPEQLLELYGFDASPFTRLVRERLCELELAYVCRNVAKERWQDMGTAKLRSLLGEYTPIKGGKREQVLNEVMQGRMQLPYLLDPNTDTAMYESKDILEYLNTTYS